ncbi:hypothetical protein AL544_017605 [Vibrio mimicus]|uniref:Uncharacterized protein n=1 Tax=Vibrio mimicus TaxID=674 RepID=A0A2J9V1R8_VIBMI|nr:hypothetical protein AL543_21680 [Vibrio mimicus]PNM57726.1 hypothetical protein AL544_017605 [Vibrio mimicus]
MSLWLTTSASFGVSFRVERRYLLVRILWYPFHQSLRDRFNRSNVIPFLLQVAAVLAAFVHPNHIVCLCSWGFTHLPPTCHSK